MRGEREPWIPTVSQPSPTGERSSDIFSRLLAQRVVFLGRPVDAEVANLIAAQLVHLEQEDPEEDIAITVNSPGGDIPAALAVYDAMQQVAPEVATTCVGVAASAAALVLAGGAPGKRTILPHARVLVHQPTVPGGLEGGASELEIQAREVLRQREEVVEVLARHTGQDPERVRRDIEHDRWMTAPEAVEYGVVDEVLAPVPAEGQGPSRDD